MNQYIYIIKEKQKSKGYNPPIEYDGDYPPLRYVATNGQEMVRIMTEAWNENKQAEYFTFVDDINKVTIKRLDIPTVLSTSVNEANKCDDALSWLKIAVTKL